jgi:uncharacterized protein
VILLLASLVLSNVVAVTDVPNPRTSNRWVSDSANIIDADAEAKIEAIAQRLYDGRTIELAVVTVDDTRDTPKAFATALFAHWGIGNAQTNNGVLVLMVMGKRRLEIETGTGIEAALPASWLSDMQARDMVPKFKSRDFGGGLLAGVEAINAHIGAAPGESTSTATPGEYRSNSRVVDPDSPSRPVVEPGPSTSTTRPVASTPVEDEGSNAVPFALGGLGVLTAGGTALALRQRRRKRMCTTCNPHQTMLALDEIADDAHLDEGQRAEERISSVNYEVLVCPGCQGTRTLRHGKWFSGFSKCTKCSYKTLSSTSTTIVHATYDHGGQVRVTDSCKHCSYSNTYTRHTARRTRPSTTTSSTRSSYSSSSSSRSSYSSSSRSSSFGGGSSRGGGSGSSW